jgi:DNA-binding MarR family transcriptional regulator
MNAIAGLEATRGCHCLIARKTARALTRHYEKYLRPHGLRATQFSVLAALTLKGPTRLGELARMLDLERTTLTRVAGLLKARDWITDGETSDGRERLLYVTDAGRSVLNAALPAWLEAQQVTSERLGNGMASPGEVSNECRATSRQFVERALLDFGLMNAFESRPAPERERCLRWIANAEEEREEERRVSRVLDDLVHSRPLPMSVEGAPAGH